MKKKKGLIIALVILVVLVLIIGLVMRSMSGSTEVLSDGIETTEYQKQDLSDTISATGTVESQNVVSVTTDLTSKVTELNVALGDYVETGDALCSFDTSSIESQIETLESQLSQSEALAAKQLEIAKRQVDEAKATQTATLNEQSAAVSSAQAQLDAANNQLAALQATDTTNMTEDEIQELQSSITSLQSSITELTSNLASAKAAYSSAQTSTNQAVQSAQDNVDTTSLSSSSSSDSVTQLATLYRQLDEATIYAEQSGIITSLNITQGSVASGVMMTISDDKNLQIKVTISEKNIVKMSEGLDATITAEALGDEEMNGTVSRVINFTTTSTTSDGSTSSSGYSANIKVLGDTDLLLGMTAKVKIMIQDSGQELAVPYDSIFQDEEGNDCVYKAVASDTDGMYEIVKAVVTQGDSNSYYVAVTSDDLTEGDQIVQSPDLVSEGDLVTLSDAVTDITESLEDDSTTTE